MLHAKALRNALNVSFGTKQKDYDAFSIFIGQPREFPMMVERSIQLQPGSEHFIELSASVVSASGIQQHILSEDRNCYFPDEGNLEFYEGYTFSNCRLECAIKQSESIYNCTPWHLPRVGTLNNAESNLTNLLLYH